MSVTYTAALGNTWTLTHWAKTGTEPTSSWILVGFITTEPQWELSESLVGFRVLIVAQRWRTNWCPQRRGFDPWPHSVGGGIWLWAVAVGHRHDLNLVLLWLWCRLVAAALVWLLAREPPCAASVALKSKKQNKTKQTRTNQVSGPISKIRYICSQG